MPEENNASTRRGRAIIAGLYAILGLAYLALVTWRTLSGSPWDAQAWLYAALSTTWIGLGVLWWRRRGRS